MQHYIYSLADSCVYNLSNYSLYISYYNVFGVILDWRGPGIIIEHWYEEELFSWRIHTRIYIRVFKLTKDY